MEWLLRTRFFFKVRQKQKVSVKAVLIVAAVLLHALIAQSYSTRTEQQGPCLILFCVLLGVVNVFTLSSQYTETAFESHLHTIRMCPQHLTPFSIH